MKIIKVAYAGELCSQPQGKNPSGKLDSQIFLEKQDPSKPSKKKKAKKKSKCNSCSINNVSDETISERRAP
jgi:hypothetical protein